MSKKILLTICTMTLLSACAQNTPTPAEKSSQVTQVPTRNFSDEDVSFTLSYPEGWELDQVSPHFVTLTNPNNPEAMEPDVSVSYMPSITEWAEDNFGISRIEKLSEAVEKASDLTNAGDTTVGNQAAIIILTRPSYSHSLTKFVSVGVEINSSLYLIDFNRRSAFTDLTVEELAILNSIQFKQ